MKKIEIVEQSKSRWIDTSHIVRFEARGNCTTVWLTDNTLAFSTKTLKHYHNLLNEKGFYRIHDKHLINLTYLEVQTKGKINSVILSCKTTLPISFRRKGRFNVFMKNWQYT